MLFFWIRIPVGQEVWIFSLMFWITIRNSRAFLTFERTWAIWWWFFFLKQDDEYSPQAHTTPIRTIWSMGMIWGKIMGRRSPLLGVPGEIPKQVRNHQRRESCKVQHNDPFSVPNNRSLFLHIGTANLASNFFIFPRNKVTLLYLPHIFIIFPHLTIFDRWQFEASGHLRRRQCRRRR